MAGRILSNALALVRSPRMIAPYSCWCLSRALLRRPPVVELDYGVRLGNWVNFGEYLRWRDGVNAAERRIFSDCRRKLQTPAVAFDVGGNIGQTALALAASGYDHVHTFEPIPPTYARLAANLRLNPMYTSITPNPTGVGESEGSFSFSHSTTSPGQSALLKSRDAPGIPLPVTTLDAYCESKGIAEIGFLKIDVEGFELQVLKGATGLLARGAVKAIYTEVITLALEEAGASPRRLYEYMVAFGYWPINPLETSEAQAYLSADEIADRVDLDRNILWMQKTPT